jgi:hypothetical protein
MATLTVPSGVASFIGECDSALHDGAQHEDRSQPQDDPSEVRAHGAAVDLRVPCDAPTTLCCVPGPQLLLGPSRLLPSRLATRPCCAELNPRWGVIAGM